MANAVGEASDAFRWLQKAVGGEPSLGKMMRMVGSFVSSVTSALSRRLTPKGDIDEEKSEVSSGSGGMLGQMRSAPGWWSMSLFLEQQIHELFTRFSRPDTSRQSSNRKKFMLCILSQS